MKRLLAMLLCVMMVLCLFAGCGDKAEAPATENTTAAEPTVESTETAENETTEDTTAAVADNQLDLMGDYVVTDPEGVEFDQRIALYKPTVPGTEEADAGMTDMYMVFYGKENKGVYLYNVMVFETTEQAAAYAAGNDKMTVDGNILINVSDAAFFAAMEAYIPNLETWINNNMASGMMEID